ncbi:MAG TPA: MarR family winged helix-turn-helix transcriptional regulator [Burkholderiaceae bacterium]|nr:MarR family winged helix-turn-helix transcriptional regulator [Burkholderiaceae bacterium]
MSTPQPPATEPYWHQTHLGRVLAQALKQFDQRVLALMAHDTLAPLTLTRLAERQQVCSAHLHILRHLPVAGARLTALSQQADMTKQAMAQAVEQCAAWGLVSAQPDPVDRRARLITFTPLGLTWLTVYGQAVAQAEAEFRQQVGKDIATVVYLGLEAYAGST